MAFDGAGLIEKGGEFFLDVWFGFGETIGDLGDDLFGKIEDVLGAAVVGGEIDNFGLVVIFEIGKV